MEREANLPGSSPSKRSLVNQHESHLHHCSSSNTSSSSSSFPSSSPGLLRQVQAAFKRHGPRGTVPLTNMRPRRAVVSHREVSEGSVSHADVGVESKKIKNDEQISRRVSVNENQVVASGRPPSTASTITNTYDNGFSAYDVKDDLHRSLDGYKKVDAGSSVVVESQDRPLVDCVRKVQFSLGNTSRPQETEYVLSNQPEPVTAINHDLKHQNLTNQYTDNSLKSDMVNSSLLAKRTTELQDQLYKFRNLVPVDLSYPMTQASVIGSSTTLTNSTSAPLFNYTTNYPCPQMISGPNVAIESNKECLVTSEPVCHGKIVHPSYSFNCNSMMSVDHITNETPHASSRAGQIEPKEYDEIGNQRKNNMLKESDISKNPSLLDGKVNQAQELSAGMQSQHALPKNSTPDSLIESSKSEKQDKAPSGKSTARHRKKGYDSDLFFNVNGKLYQRLGKIGSGGSSEVHKVISSDCTIFALKVIKLKGRDYSTAYGFCQEIEYLNKLKGKNNIIQLIDYEVTDKTLFQEVVSGSMNNKDGRIKDDRYIYMVLEHGEIDLAHMLSQKWREIEGTSLTIDENWLRFYWQQILQAVNTIHEERIVHSDLKPANFLLVKGSLKLIDFGIAKAIMSDTTNIQRDSQVGTLSYMSPEAFMCNETDSKGNVIKCGRSSDIWSLGCILYQMVYGRTPFAEYKTFWAKFKVITNPNHEIIYEPISNPWLLDIMKKCLAWDRDERWRIPELLQHPFLVPQTLHQLPASSVKDLIRVLPESCRNNPRVVALCYELRQLLEPELKLKDDYCSMFGQMSNVCNQLQEELSGGLGDESSS
ncbi:serine/threonine-protein kinase MPS1-like [Impatiens glandulifera]|uniref:serine/threonine-protein kinase MPS1-like n=1 Tax=Impatiens glandulifera TaxID=253017 RepID=UPI001FB0F5E6|nr:serine/threonine-protein kinase MPS1-like [Impatiens glandulifera]